MKQLATLFIFLSLSVFAAGQARISGRVLDLDNMPLPSANVLLSDTSGTLLKASVTDLSGMFSLVAPREGLMVLEITAIGFKTFQRDLQVGSEDMPLADIALGANTEVLGSANIVTTKPLVSVDPDKTVLNVEEHLSSTGDNGLELLRKAPGVMVDNNDAIMVEGKSGVQVFIDGRPSPLRGEDLTNYLKTLQAGDVSSIEIITQPSSKYDAAGNAGIINIILKREKGLGTNGTVNAGFTRGQRNRYNGSVSMNHRNKRMNLFGSYNAFVGESTRFMDLYRQQSGLIFDSSTRTDNENDSHGVQIGGDIYAGDRSTFGFIVSGNLNENTSRTNSYTPIFSDGGIVADSILFAPTVGISSAEVFSSNVNYRFKDTTGTTLSFDVDYALYNRDRLDEQPNFYQSPNGETIYNERISEQSTPIRIDLFSAKGDYERNAFGGKLAVGVKLADVNTENTMDFFRIEDNIATVDSNRTNTFAYREQVYAAYVNYNTSFGKFKLQSGVRMEHTESSGVLEALIPTNDDRVDRSYTNWFPSGGLTYAANPMNSIALIYSRRIERPDYASLNPFEYQLDELSFRRGNPFLQPQYTDNIKVSHTWRYTLTTSFSASFIQDVFSQVTAAEGETKNFLITRNVADQQVYNLSVSYPFKLKPWWSVYANLYGFYANFTANDPSFVPVDRVTYGGYAQNTFTVNPKLSFEISGWYSSPSIWGGTYLTEAMGSLNLGAKYNFSESGSIRVAVNDILFTQPWQGNTEYAGVIIRGTGGYDSRQVRINLSWRFGDKDVREMKKRKTGLEDEQNRIGS